MKLYCYLIFAVFTSTICISCTTEPVTNNAANSINNKRQNPNSAEVVYFRKVIEPNEGAFTLLVPKGWQTCGGIFRLNAATSGGAANAVAAK